MDISFQLNRVWIFLPLGKHILSQPISVEELFKRSQSQTRTLKPSPHLFIYTSIGTTPVIRINTGIPEENNARPRNVEFSLDFT